MPSRRVIYEKDITWSHHAINKRKYISTQSADIM